MALLDTHRTGVVLTSIVHRDQARIYLKQMHERRAGDRAVARGAAGGRAGAEHARVAGRLSGRRLARRVPGTRGHVRRGGAARVGARGGVEELPYPTIFEAVMAVQSGAVDRAVVPIENSIEGSVNATLDALAHEATDVRIVAEVDHPVHQTLIAADGVALARRHARDVAPAGDRAVPALHRRAAAGRRDRLDAVDRRGRAHRGRAPTSRGPRSGRAWPPTCTAAPCWPSASRTTPTTSPGSSGSRPPGTEPPAPADQDVGRVLGLQRPLAGSAHARARRVRRPRDQPDEDRVAAAAGGDRPLHVLRRPRGRRRRAARGTRRSTRCAGGSRCCACSGRTRPLLRAS